MASVPAADAAVAVASSATLRRMYERKEDMRPAVGGTVCNRNRIRVNLHANAGRGGRSRRGTGDGIHSCIKGGGGGQDRDGGGGRYRRFVGSERGHRREMGSRAATSASVPVRASCSGWARSRRGCAGRGERTTIRGGGDPHATNSCWTTVRDGGDMLTRSEDRRHSLMGCADRSKGGGHPRRKCSACRELGPRRERRAHQERGLVPFPRRCQCRS